MQRLIGAIVKANTENDQQARLLAKVRAELPARRQHGPLWYEDESEWRFLRSGVQVWYCPRDHFVDFDSSNLRNLTLPWSEDRIAEVEDGDDLNTVELVQWQRAMADHNVSSSDPAFVADIVPLSAISASIIEEGVAVFLSGTGNAPEDRPFLQGAFRDQAEAIKHLRSTGAALAATKPV